MNKIPNDWELKGCSHYPISRITCKIGTIFPSLKEAAAGAKSLHLCPTLCCPIDGSPPGSSIHGIFQATVLEWGAIAFSVKRGRGLFNHSEVWWVWCVIMVGSIQLYDWSVHLLLGDFPACSHQFVAKSGFHLYSLYTHIQYISAPPQHTHTTLTELDYAHSWGIRDFLISPQDEKHSSISAHRLQCVHCGHLTVALPIVLYRSETCSSTYLQF